MAQINIAAVIVSGIISIVLGMIWHSPKVFGTMWMKLAGVEDVKLSKSEMTGEIIGGIVSYIIMAYVLAMFLANTNTASIGLGLFIAFLAWLGFIGTATLGMVLWGKKPLKLYILNNVYNLIVLLIMAWIFNGLGLI